MRGLLLDQAVRRCPSHPDRRLSDHMSRIEGEEDDRGLEFVEIGVGVQQLLKILAKGIDMDLRPKPAAQQSHPDGGNQVRYGRRTQNRQADRRSRQVRRRNLPQFPLGKRVQPFGAQEIDLKTGQSRQCVRAGAVFSDERIEFAAPVGILR